jgi:hypothetical protein
MAEESPSLPDIHAMDVANFRRTVPVNTFTVLSDQVSPADFGSSFRYGPTLEDDRSFPRQRPHVRRRRLMHVFTRKHL